jgi:hypothetical protein
MKAVSAWEWTVSIFYALCFAILVILIVTLLLALVAWAIKGCKKKGCCKSTCSPLCPVYLRNPHPDDRVFQLARVDGSTSGSDNSCATGSFTIQRVNSGELLYTVTTPPDTLITDIYVLEVLCENDFPLTLDHCGVDLTQFHHESYLCEETSNVQSFTSTLSQSVSCSTSGRIFVSLLVVFSDSETCDPVQMMTISGHCVKPITLTGNCITPPCPSGSCCDPIVPSFIKLRLPKCRLLESSSTSTNNTTANAAPETTLDSTTLGSTTQQPPTVPAAGAQPASRPAAQPATQLAAQPASQPAAQLASQPATQPATESTAPPTSQPAAQLTAPPATESTAESAAHIAAHTTAQPTTQALDSNINNNNNNNNNSVVV